MNKKLIIIPILIVILIIPSLIMVILIASSNPPNTIYQPFFQTLEDQQFYYSSFSVDEEENLYIGTSHKQRWQAEGGTWSEHYYLYSFYSNNNSKRWEFKTSNSEMIKGDPAIHPNGLIIFVTEAYSLINKGSNYFNATYNKIYAINMKNGTLNWASHKLVKDITDGAWGSNGLHPAIDSDGNIFVQSQNNITSFDSEGNLRWKNDTVDGLMNFNYAGSPSIYNDTVYFPSGDTYNLYISAFTTNGDFRWTYKLPGSNNRFNMISIDETGKLYAGTENNTFHIINPDGTKNNTFTISTSGARVRGNVAIDNDGTIYLGTKNNENSEFYALNSYGSSVKWKFNGPLSDVYSSPTIASDGSLFFATEDRCIFRVNKENGNLIKKYELQEDITWCSTTFDYDGTLYIGDMGGFLYAIETRNLTLAETPWPCLGANLRRTRYIFN